MIFSSAQPLPTPPIRPPHNRDAQRHIRCLETLFAVFPESVQLIMKPLNSLCFQCSPALPGGAEEATTESDKEDQHLHRHLHALLRSLCDHKVSAGERPMQEGGERETTLTHCGIHSLFFCFVGIPQNLPPLLSTPAPPLPPPLCFLSTSARVGR